MKKWRKLIWAKSRAFINLRLGELEFAQLKIGEPYQYCVKAERRKLVIRFRRLK